MSKEIRQFTRDEILEIAESGLWKHWTAEQKTRFQLFQELLSMPFDVFHDAVEKTLGRPVFTHEFADQEKLQKEFLGEKEPPSLEEIMDMIPVDKRIILEVPDVDQG